MIAEADILAAKILIVDDQETNVLLLEQLLGDAGFTGISTTMDPHEVCELHRQHHYDLILLDLQMPGMDGFQVMEALKDIEKTLESGSYVPVLVITAQPNHKLRALQAGAKDFISKPYNLIELQTRIRNMLEVRLLHKKVKQDNLTLEQAVRERTAELSASEARFRSLTQLSSDWYWEQDANGRFVNSSGPVLAMLGHGLHSRANGELSDADPAYVEAWNEKERAELAANINLRRPFLDFTYSRTKRDGTRRYLQVSGEPIFDSSGRFTGYRGIGTDVTNRMRVDEDVRRFRLAMDAIPDAILLISRATMRIVDLNETARDMFGYTREELLKLDFSSVSEVSRDELESRYDSVIAGDTSFGMIRLLLTRKDSVKFPGQVILRAQPSGEDWIMVLMICDIDKHTEASHQSAHHSAHSANS